MDATHPPGGHRRAADGIGIVLIDPDVCPQGHPFAFGQRKGVTPCQEHGPHQHWICRCGQNVHRHAGAFVGEMDCASRV